MQAIINQLMNRKKKIALLACGLLCVLAVHARPGTASATSSADSLFWDIYPDTWVATDALGRAMPGIQEAGALKTGRRRVVGIFYITWHSDGLSRLPAPYGTDVSRVLAEHPEARLDGNHPAWTGASYHWGEPEMGYFLSRDEYVIRKDMSMLADAGVDVLIMDVTNAVRYWDEWETLFSTMQQMRREGNKVPAFCFWAFNGTVITVVQELYDRIYKEGKYKDLWFYWDGKPLLLCNGNPAVDANGGGVQNPNPHYDPKAATDPQHPHYRDKDYTSPFYADYTQEVKDFFTMRTMWWGYYEWAGKRFVGTEDNWSFGYDLGDERVRRLSPEERAATHRGVKEQMAVTPAQHPISIIGKSWSAAQGEPALDERDMPREAYVPWLGKRVNDPAAYGIYFQERWEEALAVDPEFLYLNDWNEWTAGKYAAGRAPGSTLPGPTQFLGRESNFYFVDQYNAEFNRTIQPMRGGYTDNYYMQMAQNIRRYKGVRPLPESRGFRRMRTDGAFGDWEAVDVEYRDTRGDVTHRDYDGYGGNHYTDTSGRNDIVRAKVAVGRRRIHFYVETSLPISPCTDPRWMWLLIDADNDPSTGWHGYDFIVNRRVADSRTTTLMKYDSRSESWVEVGTLPFRVQGNRMELSISRKALGLAGRSMVFDFKWADHPGELTTPIAFIEGDAAPNRRFNYRFVWRK